MTSSNPSWKDIKAVVAGWSETQLVGLVQDLYRLSPDNAAFINARLVTNTTSSKTLDPYKKRIRAAISPREPWKQGVRLAEGRKAISDFRKANGNAQDTLLLMTYYVQCGNDHTLEFGDINEPFYDSMCSMVRQIKDTLLKMQDQELADKILPLLITEFERIDGQMGWGYPDEFGDHVDELQQVYG